MTPMTWMLELDRTIWRLHVCCDDGESQTVEKEFAASDLPAQAQQIHDDLAASGYRGEPIVVALASSLTLGATLAVDRPQDFRDRPTMMFRLEECIPWSAEDFVGDFIRAGDKAVFVAAAAEPLAAFFAQLEKLGIFVQSILPKALLAAAEHFRSGEWPAQYILAFSQQAWVDLLLIDSGKPVTLLSMPANGPSLGNEMRKLVTDYGFALPLVSCDFDERLSSVNELTAADFIASHTKLSESYDALTLAAAKRVVRGEMESPVELKRAAFGRTRGHTALRPYKAVLHAAVGTVFLIVAVALLWRAHVASREVNLFGAREVEAFRRIFPNTKVPVGIRGRLESELAKLKGLQGGDTSLTSSVSAITTLHGLLSALPPDRRFRVLEIRIEDGRLYVDAEVREHGDAELIAQRLRSAGFEIASPRTQRVDDKRVSLRITGTRTPTVKLASRKSP